MKSRVPSSVVLTRSGARAADSAGAVVIGRNEGNRLRICLQVLLDAGIKVVYVDSGSTDGSIERARRLGVRVVALDMSQPFTAARARNAGWATLRQWAPETEFVQFVDGDCELLAGWLPHASRFLRSNAKHAVVFGRLRERHPQASCFNRLCDIEWNGPLGDTTSCGGVAMVRMSALVAVQGFREDLIAGEEPELCLRLRRLGWRVRRLAKNMALHDAAIHRFSQWWRRSRRSGYAFAQGAWLHGREAERHWVKETIRAVTWGAGIPITIVCGSVWIGPWVALSALLYPLQVMRLMRRAPERPGAVAWAFFTTLGKFAECAGVLQFAARTLLARPARLIEYK